jgi:opine dehydrogenase
MENIKLDCKEAVKRVFVCGAGHQGLTMSAHLALNGLEVNLWNRTQKNIQKVLDTGVIHCTGIVNGDAKIAKVSTNMEDVVSDFVMVTTPSSAHKDIARKLAPYVHKNMVIILNPGRTFGAVEFAEELKKCGVNELPHIAETQTIVYTCRKSGENSTNILALKNDVEIAAIQGSSIDYIMSLMPDCLKPYFKVVDSVAMTSFSNVGMVLHCAPVLMNIGWIETTKVDFKYYYDGISHSVAHYLEKIDKERQAVAKASGFEIESVKEWLARVYDASGDTLFECIRNNEAYKEIDAPPTINTRYIFEDVPNGLVPIEFLGIECNVPTLNITTIINLACSIMDEDYRQNGRRFSFKQLKEYL